MHSATRAALLPDRSRAARGDGPSARLAAAEAARDAEDARLVLDDVLQHLDGEGVARAAAVLRAAPHAATVLLTSQAAGRALAHAYRVDYVVKESGVEHDE